MAVSSLTSNPFCLQKWVGMAVNYSGNFTTERWFLSSFIDLRTQPFGQGPRAMINLGDIADGGIPAERAIGMGDGGAGSLIGKALALVFGRKQRPADFLF